MAKPHTTFHKTDMEYCPYCGEKVKGGHDCQAVAQAAARSLPEPEYCPFCHEKVTGNHVC